MSGIDAVMQRRFQAAAKVTGDVRHFETRTRTVDVNVREIGGRPVVLYVDVPAGSRTDIINFSQVKVAPR